jgi:hypothetical protein
MWKEPTTKAEKDETSIKMQSQGTHSPHHLYGTELWTSETKGCRVHGFYEQGITRIIERHVSVRYVAKIIQLPEPDRCHLSYMFSAYASFTTMCVMAGTIIRTAAADHLFPHFFNSIRARAYLYNTAGTGLPRRVAVPPYARS